MENVKSFDEFNRITISESSPGAPVKKINKGSDQIKKISVPKPNTKKIKGLKDLIDFSKIKNIFGKSEIKSKKVNAANSIKNIKK
jgi:hypothetical protein